MSSYLPYRFGSGMGGRELARNGALEGTADDVRRVVHVEHLQHVSSPRRGLFALRIFRV